MKLFNGTIGPLFYSLTIQPANERGTHVDGEYNATVFHKAVITVADRTHNVVNMIERTYRTKTEDGSLTDTDARNIRRDLRDLAQC